LEREFEGRAAVITGGGRGFGKAFGLALAERGAAVALIDVDLPAAEQAAAQIGGKARAYAGDVTDPARMQAVMDEVAREHGGIDILVNNAGLHSQSYSRPITEMGVEKTARLFQVNIMGIVICTMAAKDAMSGRKGASIVNIASSAAYPPSTAYGVSKLAARGLTLAFSRELGPLGVRVNAIAPGLIFTDTIRAELSQENISMVMAQQVLKREGAERDIVEALLYLVSDKASFVTGETLRVTGGSAPSL
jgi:NAD(P)-dependent dehydrogenase (short-subunit alcohol dehydrogenase family)